MNKSRKAKLKGMASKFRYGRSKSKVGYNRKGYNFNKSVKAYKKTGLFKTIKGGSGHDAGYRWAQAKGIDPNSQVKRYSKNSPSFDEGVYGYKDAQKQKMAGMAAKVKKSGSPPNKKS